jgi:hypothetical protein
MNASNNLNLGGLLINVGAFSSSLVCQHFVESPTHFQEAELVRQARTQLSFILCAWLDNVCTTGMSLINTITV